MSRTIEWREGPISVPCRACRAEAGEVCLNAYGEEIRENWHQARHRAWDDAAGWNERE